MQIPRRALELPGKDESGTYARKILRIYFSFICLTTISREKKRTVTS